MGLEYAVRQLLLLCRGWEEFWSVFLELPKLRHLEIREIESPGGNPSRLGEHRQLSSVVFSCLRASNTFLNDLLSIPQLTELEVTENANDDLVGHI